MADMSSRKECFQQQACGGFYSADCDGKFSKMTGNSFKNAKLSETKTLYFEPMTRNDIKFETRLDLKADLIHVKSGTKFNCKVVVQQNGQYEISFCPVYRGKHELHISVNEVPVRGSPFPITVTGLPEKPVRVVQGLNNPRSVVVNSKNQFVVVEMTSISVWTAEWEKIRTFGQLIQPHGVTVDQDDNIYVFEQDKCRIHKFSSEGVLLATVGSTGSGDLEFICPYDICYNRGDNNLYAIDNINHRVQVLTTDFKFVRCFGGHGKVNGKFWFPKWAAFDSANNLYVTDSMNQRVQVFTADGQFLRAFSQMPYDQTLGCPFSIAIDSSDTVYVNESGRCLCVFTSQGEYITTIGERGSAEEGQFLNMYGLCVDRNDRVIVCDCCNDRLQIF